MNCPFHILIYKTQTRSYRDLPLRWAEMGTVYRYERSGVLHGMLRVRGFTQDDAHIFCRPDQLEDEIVGVVELARFMMSSFGFDEYEVYLSVRDPDNKDKFIGDDDVWERSEGALAAALRRMDIDYHVDVGEAKFYGPAIDIKYRDAIRREWQGPTIQCDFNLPQRFDITFIGQDGKEHRPVMIHRTVLGSMERFVGSLIEHYAGAFPVWLAPEQVRIVPITDRHHEYADQLQERFQQAKLRAEVDKRSEKVGYKIRQAELDKIPYMLVVGDREVEAGTVSVRTREEGDIGEQEVDVFVSDIVKKVEERVVCID
jgi:threonyl-tRNA synthetase